MTAEEVEEACRDYLCVETPEAPRALAVLESAFPDAAFTMMPDDAIRLSGVGADEVGRVLLAAEVPVSGLYTHARDIEDYFIGLMGGTSSVRSCSTECRLVRNRAFWGLLAVFGVLVFLFVIQVDEQSVREGVYRNFPALGGAPEGVGMTMDVEAVLGQFWVPQLLLAFVGMLSAAFFGDDFRYVGVRSLDVMPGFRWRYVGSAVLIIVVIALIFLAAASFVAWLALLPNPAMSVGLSGGRFLRWALCWW